ncbi:MAG: peptidoglycan-binding protein [Proteobacteria bacterium]|nr:peptidoglycan-binding protein [Pseudomonadota bacterium]
MTDQPPSRIPEWLSLQDIARAWSEETGESAEALEGNFREWFKEFLVRNAYAEAGAGDDGIPAEMLEGRQIWRETFETFCEETGQAKPRFWFPNAPIGQTAARPAQVPEHAPVHFAAADEAASEDETATQAPDQVKPEPPPRRRVRVGGASFTRIALALVGVVVLGLVALWALEPDGPVAERDRDRQPGAEQLAAMAPSVATAPAPAETSESPSAASASTETTQAPSAASASTGTAETQIAETQTAAADQVDEGLVLLIQRELRSAGFDPGPLDGRSGPKFSAAIAAYQRAQGLPVDGRVSIDLLSRLARENLRQGRTAPFLPSPGASQDTGVGAGAPDRQTALQTPAAGASPAPRGKSLVRSIQERLAARGYYSGPLDGSLGPKTRAAIETYQRAQRYETTGRPSRALYEELEDYRLEVLGLKLFRQGAYDQAIATYSRMIKRQPKDANAYFNRGLAYKNAGLADRALADYDAAIRLDPSHQKAYLDRGNIRYQRGFYSDAIRDYMNALGLWLGLS